MKSYRTLLVTAVIIMASLMSLSVSAKIKCVPKIYAFGFAASFNDSIVYFTDIQEIDSAWVGEKNEFLVNRENYFLSTQKLFKQNRTGTSHMCNQLCTHTQGYREEIQEDER